MTRGTPEHQLDVGPSGDGSSTTDYLIDRPRLDGQIMLAEHDPAWAATADNLMQEIRQVHQDADFVLAHVGSTSVPGLAAKPVIDLVMSVRDPVDEPAYVPALEFLGYRLHVREPDWYQHRLLKRDEPKANLHVFAADHGEIERMIAFRDHLRSNAADRDLYLRTKRKLAARTWEFVQDYADAKSEVVEAILGRALLRRAPTAADNFEP